MKANPKISVLVPVYGVENFVERCAESLFQQTYENMEFIFVDDCSPDNSIAVLERVIERYPSRTDAVRIIHHPKNLGLSCARNTAIAAADGDFILIVDSDDYITTDAVSRMVKEQALSNADIVTGGAMWDYGDRQIPFDPYSPESKEAFILDILSAAYYHRVWGRLLRRDLFIKHGIHAIESVNVGEDMQMMVQLAYYADSVSFFDEPVYYYNSEPRDAYTRGYSPSHIIQELESYLFVRGFIQGKGKVFEMRAEERLVTLLHERLAQCAREGDKKSFLLVSGYCRQVPMRNAMHSKLVLTCKVCPYLGWLLMRGIKM